MFFHRRWLLILFVLVLGGGPVFAATKEQTAYAAAVAAFQREMWGQAEMELAQFIQKYPKSTNAPMALLLEAQAEFKQRNFTGAIAKLANPDNLAKAAGLADQYFYWTGEAQFTNGNFTAAADTWVSLSEKFPGSPLRLRAVVEAASAFGRMTNWSKADDLLGNPDGVFQRAVKLDPGNELVVDGWLSLENSKFQQRDFPGVLAVYGRLTNQWQMLNQLQQCESVYLFYRAGLELGDFAAALAAATNLVQIASSPANQDWLATGWASQAGALERLGRLPDAVEAWQNNLTNAPPELEREAILKIAEQEILQGQLTNAGVALDNFLARFPLALSADIALLTAGELHLKNYAAQPAATNQLPAARDCFNQFLLTFPGSPFKAKAYLDRGWCDWLAGDATNSLADFSAVATNQPAPEDLAVARFKMGDAQFAMKDFAGARTNYQAVLDDFTNYPTVARALGDRALYQILRADLQLTNYDGASNALAQIVKQYPANALAADSALLYGAGLADASRPAAARAVFEQFLARFPDSPLRSEVEFAVTRTYELEQNWSSAVAGYQGWLEHFPTNPSKPRVIYALALANAQAGNEMDAFALFTNFVAQFPTNHLAPLAQWWVADHFFNSGTNYVSAENNYEAVFTTWPGSDLAGQARLMAGTAAMARSDYSGAHDYFSKLAADTNCLDKLRVQAALDDGAALMHMDSIVTNNPSYNYHIATNVFSQVSLLDPTNEAASLLALCAIGGCDVQLGNFDAATNAFAQVFNSTNAAATVALRSRAQIAFGVALETEAAEPDGTNQIALRQLALKNYLDVFDTSFGENLRADETADAFWVAEAGRRAAAAAEALGEWGSAADIYGQMKTRFPPMADSLDKKIAAAKAHLSETKN